jgi:6-pyruvoyltetrahydropterin/6-carboxytetrahydropterin synthase
MTQILAVRYHDISCGHRVVGHESKCKWFHGHNYRFTFSIAAAGGLDEIGRVIDFSLIKKLLCQWLEDTWDHRFLMWEEDPYLQVVDDEFPNGGFLAVPFNPTAENMGKYLLEVVGPKLLDSYAVGLVSVQVEETRKCSALVTL